MSETEYKPLPVLTLDAEPPSSGTAGEAGCGCHDDHHNETHAALQKVQDRLATSRGKHYWRSLDELSDTPEFHKFLETEFPSKHDLWMEPVSRRDFLKLMGAGMAMMFFSGCRRPMEKIFPYHDNPENLIPGKPLFYASALTMGGYAQGVIVETHEGRPTKIEGNPQHPDSLGATDVFMQAAILEFYDPDRSQAVTNAGITSSWESFLTGLQGEIVAQLASQGAGLRILSGTCTSPTLAGQIALLLKKFPQAKWTQYEPLARRNALEGARLAFGEILNTRYEFQNADVIVALDADFMGSGPDKIRNARGFAQGRNLVNGKQAMNRLYAVEPCPTVTGASADHRLPLRAADVEIFARSLAAQLGMSGVSALRDLDAAAKAWLGPMADDLRSHRGRSLIIAGESQPPAVHALAHAMNEALGNSGRTVVYTNPVEIEPADGVAGLRELAKDMSDKKVDLLLIIGGNPVYDSPADFNFAKAMEHVKTRVRFGLFEDETSDLCHWHIPAAHALESWTDARATDGTVTITQPMIEPLYGGKTVHELLSPFLDDAPRTSHDIVKDFWRFQHHGIDFDTFWKTSLHDGLVAGSAFEAKRAAVRSGLLANLPAPIASNSASANSTEIVFQADPSLWDGRFANNGWLQELAKPITKLTWDNAVLISPATATRLGVESKQVVKLTLGQRSVSGPAWITPGHADNSLTVYLGFGRRLAGRVGNDRGFDVYPLRQSDQLYFAPNVAMEPTAAHATLACTQIHHGMEGRNIVRGATLAEYSRDAKFAEVEGDNPTPADSLYNSPKVDEKLGWGMSIDMNLCIGCNACVIGCQAENNIAVVGKDQVLRGREMQWIRIDNYFSGHPDNPEFTHQPVPCMHCENAPCEPVCPVGATVHNDEGINEMVYNRCIGTRYCSNNCPYKVRRFNFYEFTEQTTESYKLGRNPDVTVRGRGVMEKCSYCIQRINVAKFAADKEDRDVRDGDVVTACQAACPTQAIVFGNMRDPKSAVSRMKTEPRNYPLLGELGTRPHTTFLAKVRNTNPALENA